MDLAVELDLLLAGGHVVDESVVVLRRRVQLVHDPCLVDLRGDNV